jgi:hypothetical protein
MATNAIDATLRTKTESGARRWLVALAVTAALLLANKYLPYTVRFSYSPLNNGALILLLGALPVCLIGLSTSLQVRWARWFALSLGLLVSLPVGLMVLLSALDAISNIAQGRDLSFDQIAELRTSGAMYRAYRTNGGAMTDFGLVFRREHDVLPGVRLVSVLMSQYHASDAVLTTTSTGAVKIAVAPYGEEHPGFAREFPQ